MSKTLEQIELELDAKIPRDVVETREGGGGKTLSYLPTHYVIDRLNKVFGPLNWDKEIIEIKEIVNTVTKTDYKTKNQVEYKFPAYIVKVRLAVKVGGAGYSIKEAYGYGSDKSGLNPHELAIKEAVSDALKVAAKDFGMSMGLALYDKSQENVDDGQDESKVSQGRSPSVRNTKEADTKSATTSTKEDKRQPPLETTVSEVEKTTTTSRETLEEAIRSYVSVAKAQKRLTVEDFKDYLQKEFTQGKLADITTEGLQKVLEHLKKLTA